MAQFTFSVNMIRLIGPFRRVFKSVLTPFGQVIMTSSTANPGGRPVGTWADICAVCPIRRRSGPTQKSRWSAAWGKVTQATSSSPAHNNNCREWPARQWRKESHFQKMALYQNENKSVISCVISFILQFNSSLNALSKVFWVQSDTKLI